MDSTEDMKDTLLAVSVEETIERKRYINLTQEDECVLIELYPLIKTKADEIVDVFYQNIERYPELMNIIDKADSNVEKLKVAQKRYLLELFEGKYDENYFERRRRIGFVHNKIGLTPRWYIGSYSVYSEFIVGLINKKYFFQPKKRLRAIVALNKVISLDMQSAMDTYIDGLMFDLKSISLSKGDIENRVSKYSEMIQKVSEGDLTEQIEDEGDDDLSVLGLHLNKMTDGLTKMAGSIKNSSNAISSTAEQVLNAVNAQSTGAMQQATAINETTTTLEEIRASSQQTLEKAQDLGRTAERTRQESEEGKQILEDAMVGMEAIRGQMDKIAQSILSLSDQTQQIDEITDVVNNLAQQSKMLALNASIEAAKAGEAGKGFAVVAAEVKGLAEQSQQSTAQVKKILQEIRQATERAVMVTEEGAKGADAGGVLVGKVSAVMNDLSSVINETTTASLQMVAAIRQEVIGVDQVSGAMSEINKVTAQFVGSVRETEQAAQNLQQVAAILMSAANLYKIAD